MTLKDGKEVPKMDENTPPLKTFGFTIPRPPGEIKLHTSKSDASKGYQSSINLDDLMLRIRQRDDALYYIIKECNTSIRECKQIGQKVHGDSTAWELVCEVQASLERIRDNASNELTR